MGRKSVPFADEAVLLDLRLRALLEIEEAARSLIGAWEETGEDDEETPRAASSPGAPAGLAIEHFYRINRNRARLVRLLRGNGGPLVIVAHTAAEADEWAENDGFAASSGQVRPASAACPVLH